MRKFFYIYGWIIIRCEKTTTKQSLDLTGVKNTQTKKDTFALNPSFIQKALLAASIDEKKSDDKDRHPR